MIHNIVFFDTVLFDFYSVDVVGVEGDIYVGTDWF